MVFSKVVPISLLKYAQVKNALTTEESKPDQLVVILARTGTNKLLMSIQERHRFTQMLVLKLIIAEILTRSRQFGAIPQIQRRDGNCVNLFQDPKRKSSLDLKNVLERNVKDTEDAKTRQEVEELVWLGTNRVLTRTLEPLPDIQILV